MAFTAVVCCHLLVLPCAHYACVELACCVLSPTYIRACAIGVFPMHTGQAEGYPPDASTSQLHSWVGCPTAAVGAVGDDLVGNQAASK